MKGSYRFEVEPSVLYVVSTPIGNLGDMSPRAGEVLEQAGLVACEDTRVTRRLCQALGLRLKAKLISYHEHNEAARVPEILSWLERGGSAALVSDAGTPGCSDPGFRLLSEASSRGVRVVPVPGPVAFMAALVASGLPSDRFAFLGFLPSTRSKRQVALRAVAAQVWTLCFYESPRRVVEMLEDVKAVMGSRRVCVSRELTKLHEESLRGTVDEVLEALSSRDTIRGECVVIVEGAVEEERAPELEEARRLIEVMQRERLPPKTIKAVVAAHCGLKKKEVFGLLLEGDAQN